MSLTVRHLNADSTFLLIFSPKPNPSPTDLLSAHGSFSVLIDPWLVGSSIVSAKWFAITKRLLPGSISHLSQIEEPDVVLVSQNKPDHCHKETLLQLKPEGKTLVAAEPSAARTIKSWNHFDPNRVCALVKYDAKVRFGNSLRLRIPPLGPEGFPGELNIAFIPARNYLTGLHNAFGITYQPPTKSKVVAPVTTIDLPGRSLTGPIPSTVPLPSTSVFPSLSAVMGQNDEYATRPASAPHNSGSFEDLGVKSRRLSNLQSPQLQAGELQHLNANPSITHSELTSIMAEAHFDNGTLSDTLDLVPISPALSTPSFQSSPRGSNSSGSTCLSPSSSANTSFAFSLPNSPQLVDLQNRYSRPPAIHPPRPKAISVIYSPHGIQLADLQPYIQKHLVSLAGALPLTCLFHSFDFAANPWWFGGNVMTGVEGGLEIASALMARCWISAHDEVKDDKGMAVKFLKCIRGNADMVKGKIQQGEGRWTCDVRSLGVDDQVKLTAESMPQKSHQEVAANNGLGVDMAAFQFPDGG